MYLSHFGLNEAPFTITPLTEFFYAGANRGPTLEALIYAVTHVEGIIKVTGEVGSGKTMLCRVMMERLPREVETIYLANPTLGREELLFAVADELAMDVAGKRQSQILKALQEVLIEKHAAGKYVVVLVDEAHAMPAETLEELRLLSNLETSRHKLLRMVLFGQPELDGTLNRPGMRQLKERITHSFSMQPLTQEAIREYLDFRMRAAGYRGPNVFSPGAIRQIAAASAGLTRRVNILADKALLAAFLDNTHRIEPKHVRTAIQDSEFGKLARPVRPAVAAGAALALGLAIGLGWQLLAGEWTKGGERTALPSGIPDQALAAPPAQTPVVESGPALAAVASAPAPAPTEEMPATGEVTFPALRADSFTLLNQRVSAARELLARNPERYSIQLFLTNDVQPARMERFLERAGKVVDLAQIYICPTRIGNQTNFTVIYGVYGSREAGQAAVKKLPERYQVEFSPVVRRLDEIRSAL